MESAALLAKGLLPLINVVITRLDKEAFALLAPFENKTLCFQIEGFLPLYFQIQKEGLQAISLDEKAHCDVTFSGPFSAFISLVFTKNRTQHGLHIRGDLDCAKALYDTWHHMDLDWEGYFAQYLGSNITHMLSQSVHATKAWLKNTWDTRIDDLGAYLQDEKAYLPTREEVESLHANIDTLRHDVSRFEAKLQLFQQRLKAQ